MVVMPASVLLGPDRRDTIDDVCKLTDGMQPTVRPVSCSVDAYTQEVVH